uniref:EF-hand domain-containing protein n=1 Tax=Quercus lobata TaxID=97700 RepID=A0A7N2L6Z3_QUELO
MSDGALTIVDGTQLRAADLTVVAKEDDADLMTGAKVLELAESRASSALFGLSLPQTLKSSALQSINLNDEDDVVSFRQTHLSSDQASLKLNHYLTAIADQLKDDPLVISILDGNILRLFLDDEDDFAMIAEDLFTDLDAEDKGKISKNEIRNALVHMGVEMGVPPFSERKRKRKQDRKRNFESWKREKVEELNRPNGMDYLELILTTSGQILVIALSPKEFPLLNDILRKHGAEGEEELGQAQFAQLLQPVLQELAEVLAEKPIVVIQNIKVINGSKLKKLLDDEKELNNIVDKIWEEKHGGKDGLASVELIRGFLERNGTGLGLPPSEANEAVVLLYDAAFADVKDGKIDVEVEKDELGKLVKEILNKFAELLEANPVFHDTNH